MTSTDEQRPTPDPSALDLAMRLRQMISAYQVSQAVHVAAVLGIPDLLKDGARPCDELARSSGSDEDGLYRLLRALAGVGVFAEVSPRRFALTPLSALLRSDVDGSLHALAVMNGQEWFWRPWGRLVDGVRTGGSVFEPIFGMPYFEYLQRNPAARGVFQKALAGASSRAAVADLYDFSTSRRVADIGGGTGALLAAILGRHPAVHGILLERAAVLDGAKRFLADAGVLDRCDLVDGDFFESVTAGADTYILSQVLHDWSDEAAHRILSNCRAVMPPDGKILVVERVLPEGGAQKGPLTDLNMLVLMGGRERTRGEYEVLLARAGFRITGVMAMGEAWSLIEGVPVE
ncbi:methyltransferase [Virgisporangium ochraceum]|uniref:Methyltransferase n=1 Tax=Virgisporangium ochraceum TaxID=65505 RepID=A0A8J3ZY69_9ACTN|nr:methyltransferase [Virgisporangium ochraceum]GIJ70680.1 methyltransferase [Virgisporangium ochraceum]